ncbi:signal peptide peptidase SppA [Flavobacterium franklandianum]|uniref:Signal peptide peptidase SppA n=1 Tax=Flavobacterium franklandianum TaxID=2594430 RepID=A0A553CQD5_9FLAO|nr:signal peptide peptidase SppA [Flavobacterium franklandianum]TRX22732.1 signal peptide peptidase SppA [Flavobacterium franklandianum]TRX26564.1 signal peptide peptidase SppA [Flavobacterium franklandianum]
MRFLGNVLATIVGLFVFLMLFFFGIILIAAVFGGDSEEVSVKSDSVIELKLENIKNDYAGKYKDPWVTILSEGENIGLSDIINAIEAAKTDKDIKGISILNNESELGIAQRKALRDALEDFKKSGKFVMSYANTYSQKEYYLNSVANTIYINPVGDFDFKGLSAELMFFKDLQEKSGVKMEVIRHGKYKSAVEPFLDNKMSEANREQTMSLLNSVWSSVLADISKSRNISVTKLNEIANGLMARTPEMAKAEKMVDVIAYEDVYHDAIRKKLKVDKDEDYNKISIKDYARKVATTSESNDSQDKIAVIYAQGEIMSGEGDTNTIGEGSMNRSLIEARKDENVKAIVLRIDSPGGNALTSDLIWREIELTKKVKPVVVSMGNYAASGGYYIACNANKIFAESNTITGSIGVFGILPNFTQLATKIGIHTEQIKTNENASEYSPFVPMDEKFKAITLESVEHIYKTFVSHVAAGRKMTVAQVDSIGQGRVWSGSQALKIGLVDKIGGLDDAIKEAASLAKTKKYGTQNFPEFEKDMNDIFKNFPFAKSKESFIKEELGEETFRLMEQIKRVQARKGVQAMMPFEITIQ